MNPFDICIVYISWEGGGKRRPVLLLAKDGDYAEIFCITSQYENKSDKVKAKYFEIIDWQEAGLDKKSYVDTNETVEVPAELIAVPSIGKLSSDDKRRLLEFLLG